MCVVSINIPEEILLDLHENEDDFAIYEMCACCRFIYKQKSGSKVIVNTTPLIALCHVGQLDVLKKMYGEILIPQAVYRELSEKKERDSGCYIQNPVKQINTGHYYLPIKTFFPQKANPYFRIRSSGIPFAVSAAAYSFSWI